jgi:hypothetical protein
VYELAVFVGLLELAFVYFKVDAVEDLVPDIA